MRPRNVQVQPTPGPWKSIVEPAYVNAKVYAKGKRLVAVVWSGSARRADVAEANARLIAAAPDLLEALETFIASESFEGDESDCECGDFNATDPGTTPWCRHTKARAAIAKARGE